MGIATIRVSLDDGREEHYTLQAMNTLKARVHNGRLVMDEPTDLPEGQIVELVPLEAAWIADDEELGEEDRARLHAALEASEIEFRAGRGIPAADVLRDLGRSKA